MGSSALFFLPISFQFIGIINSSYFTLPIEPILALAVLIIAIIYLSRAIIFGTLSLFHGSLLRWLDSAFFHRRALLSFSLIPALGWLLVLIGDVTDRIILMMLGYLLLGLGLLYYLGLAALYFDPENLGNQWLDLKIRKEPKP